jgi:type IV pilus assembly protein PilW
MKQLRIHSSSPRRRARGFSLVEILVGVAIGVVGMLVIFRTIATWDTHTRSTTAGSDAQSTGSLAMFNLERDIKQAGQGFLGIGFVAGTPPSALGCAVSGVDTQTGRALAFNMVPVTIGLNAGQPDTITVLYGNSPFFVSEEKYTATTGTTKTLDRRNGFRTGDVAIAGAGANCNLVQVTDDTNADGKTIVHADSVNYVNSYLVPPAPRVARYNSAGLPVLAAAGTIYSLGPNPRLDTWAINAANGSLTNTEQFSGAPAFVVGEGVVNIKALYGLDLLGNRTVNSWTNVAPTTAAGWAQVMSVRLALLVRSRQFERTADQSASGVPTGVTVNPPTWSGAAILPPIPNSNFVMTNTNGTPDSFGPNDPDPLNWRYYRYRVYEKEIPLRNVIWGMTP